MGMGEGYWFSHGEWNRSYKHRELLAKSGVEAERLDQAFAAFIHVAEHPELAFETRETGSRMNSSQPQPS